MASILQVLLYLSVFYSVHCFCTLRFRYSKVCRYYDYRYCAPAQTENCKIVKTTYKDFRCPYYDCVSNFYKIFDLKNYPYV